MPDTPVLANYLLLNYNNYYNRIIKKHDTLLEYLEDDTDVLSYGVYTNRNFPIRDGIYTDIVENDIVTFDVSNANYLIVYDNNNTILSRWFILDINQIRKGQYKIHLKRDVIVDYYNQVIEAKSYIEKAYINSSDVAIYNSEDISFNKIKQSEIKLQDETLQAWIVGYYAQVDSDKTITISDRAVNPDIIVDDITTWDFYNNTNLGSNVYYQELSVLDVLIETINNEIISGTTYPVGRKFSTSGEITKTIEASGNRLKLTGTENDFGYWVANNRQDLFDIFYNRITTFGLEKISDYSDKIIYDKTTSKYYSMKLVTGVVEDTITWDIANSQFTNDVVTLALTSGLVASGDNMNKTAGYHTVYTKYKLALTEITVSTLTTTLSQTANKLQDAPYKMFAIPWNGGSININGSSWFIGKPNPIGLQVAVEIAKTLGQGCYDLQLLPYCPVRELLTEGGSINVTTGGVHKDYDVVTDSDSNPVALILYPKFSNFSFDIEEELYVSDDPIQAKIVGECNTYRLVSPNYASMYEFNLLKTGSITKFNVDCTYKPYSPYIHINPNWSRLYGKDFNDVRGLILSGDFSLPIINDAWTQFQINNKNYQNSFDRNIESIELRNKFAVVGDVANAVTGTVGAAMVGGVAGGVASGMGGAADIVMNQYLRKDALDLTKDQFNYSLENIKALPNTLSKVSSFDYNNKLFPLLEFYTCTSQEREIFKSKLEFNGMKVMRIDQIKNFITSERHYLKAKLIRIDICCNHLANEIANELNMGVYI